METISASQEDSSNANPASVKSDDSTPPPESGRGSPPPNCAICLGTCKNKSFTDSCLHQFCFSCLLTWSKVKAECPLCKQNFKSIIHNVRSNHQYEEYMVEQRHVEENIDIDSISIEGIAQATRRFRYRTTLTLPRRDTRAIEQFLMHYPLIPRLPIPRAPPARRRRSPAAFRRTVYRHNLWARPLPDFTGRFRDCSPEFYMYNDAQMHRLVPWLTRELQYLLNENAGHISYVLTRILELLPARPVTSPEFREALRRYLGERTDHFLHELHCFASTPYDMTGYDRNVQYTTDPRVSTLVNEVLSSSDSDSDSDIVMVSEPLPGPSRAPPACVPIETISHSDTDDGSEVMVVGYIKPPQDRTPEVVDLLGSDSDVVVQDAPGPSREPEPRVKLSLRRHSPAAGQEAGPSAAAAGGARRRKRRRSGSPAAWRPWGSPSPVRSWLSSEWSGSSDTAPPPAPPSTSSSSTTSSPSSSSSSSSTSLTSSTSLSSSSSFSSSSDSSDSESAGRLTPCVSSPRTAPPTPKRRRTTKKKTKLKSSKGKSSKRSKDDKKSKSRSIKEESRSKSRRARKNQATQTKKESRKQKTRSGKGVKRSKVEPGTGEPQPSTSAAPPAPRASPPPPPPPPRDPASAPAPAPRATPPRDPAPAPAPARRRHSRASRDSRRRLRSVVKVINTQQTSDPSGISNLRNIMESAILNPNSNVLAYNSDSGSVPGDDRTRRLEEIPSAILEKAESCFDTRPPSKHSGSDSEDDLPLNLTIRRT
ncbi:E3 ubiquitin-protein ligase Topors [Plutella xylostella]|uniref:E3 ubiquitin-protein ligase Topors n=1 Tax=Plutella xylostella TaxID=51655 RepID=UPI0020328CF8|nr:E3 ubiquitin-protein ligase Topors [Plutella xylostella]